MEQSMLVRSQQRGWACQMEEQSRLQKGPCCPGTSYSTNTRQCGILSGLQDNSLVSIGKLADAGYYTLFTPGGQGSQVFDANKVKLNISAEHVLQGYRDNQGLWRVPIDDKEDFSLTSDELAQAINNVFDLPSVEQTIRYLHA